MYVQFPQTRTLRFGMVFCTVCLVSSTHLKTPLCFIIIIFLSLRNTRVKKLKHHFHVCLFFLPLNLSLSPSPFVCCMYFIIALCKDVYRRRKLVG